MQRDEIIEYMNELLGAGEIDDYGPNGLQVEGGEEVRIVVTGVSACLELFREAEARQAEMVLVHHGILWKGQNRPIRGVFRRRLKTLLQADINLAAYHLPLDCHDELGNNILAARELGLRNIQPFGKHRGVAIGYMGEIDPTPSGAFFKQVAELYQSQPLTFDFGPESIRRVGIISGGAQRELMQAIDAGLDCYVTGEASEYIMNAAREGGIHFMAAGHYATERLGIRALGEHIAQKFSLEVEFVDIPNPV